jgi:hypothetical protein
MIRRHPTPPFACPLRQASARSHTSVSHALPAQSGLDPIRKAGHQQPWIAPLDGSGARRLATTYLSGGLYSLSPDGRQVIFVDSDGKSQICDFPRFDHCRDAGGGRAGPLSVNSRIVYGVPARDEMNIVAQPVDGGAPTPVTHFSDKLVGRLRLSTDFKTLVFTRIVWESNVVLIQGLK